MNANCKRCGNQGMGNYAHVAGGMCFLCGRIPGGGVATPEMVRTARERAICHLHNLIRAAGSRIASGWTAAEWLADYQDGVDFEGCAPIAAYIDSAPADVAARARAAFARLGIKF